MWEDEVNNTMKLAFHMVWALLLLLLNTCEFFCSFACSCHRSQHTKVRWLRLWQMLNKKSKLSTFSFFLFFLRLLRPRKMPVPCSTQSSDCRTLANRTAGLLAASMRETSTIASKKAHRRKKDGTIKKKKKKLEVADHHKKWQVEQNYVSVIEHGL